MSVTTAAGAATRFSHASPALRFLGPGRLLRRRSLVLAAVLAARIGMIRAYAVWPSAELPMAGVEPRSRTAGWLWRSFDLRGAGQPGRLVRAVRESLDPATWTALRARSAVVGSPPSWLMRTFAEAIGADLAGATIALYSRSGSPLSKVMCFVFTAGATEPAALAIAMADRAQADRLRREFEFCADLRRAVAGERDLVGALPLEPLLAGERDGEYVVVVPPDPLAPATGNGDRELALAWLRRLHAATVGETRAWGPEDTERELGHVEHAWTAVRPQALAKLSRRAALLLSELEGVPVPHATVHGDFWGGNVASRDGEVRVYDWEWAEPAGPPFLDLWTYEFGELLGPAHRGDELLAPLEAACERVERELEKRALDRGFARATLSPSLARLTIRMRLVTGRPGPAEQALEGMMAAGERLLEG